MTTSLHITSPQNPRIKNAIRLSESRRHRDRSRRTVVEGSREVRLCLQMGIVPIEAFVCPELLDEADSDLHELLRRQQAARSLALSEAEGTHYATVPPKLYAKLARREASGGIFLVIPYITSSLNELAFRNEPFLVIIEGAEKPGNVGAILRTADAAGADGLILCGGTDLHNPNSIRASLGARFTVPCVQAATQDVLTWLHEQQIELIAATPAGDTRYTDASYTGPVALVTGSEAHGLGRAWLHAASRQVSIPMFGRVDSLNLATSAALMMYEVVRQRR